jgi:hypothetical protein
VEVGQLRLYPLQFLLQGLNLVVANSLPILNGIHCLLLPLLRNLLQFLPCSLQLLPEDHHIILDIPILTSICVLRDVTSSMAFCSRSACLWYSCTSPACLAVSSVIKSISLTGSTSKYSRGAPLSRGLLNGRAVRD